MNTLTEEALTAARLSHRALNERIREAFEGGASRIVLDEVLGHRYIGTGLKGDVEIIVNGPRFSTESLC